MKSLQDIRKEFNKLDQLCKVDTSNIKIEFSKRMTKTYGKCISQYGKPIKIVIADFLRNEEEQFWDTIKHEYAHAVARLRYPNERHGHDHIWKNICIEVGCKPERTAKSCESQKQVLKERIKYKVKCEKCGHTYAYQRRGKIINALLNGSKNYYCGVCQSDKLVAMYN